jgi:methionyl-tRNA synthetase
MPVPAKKFYLTTPIYYVNARPHIGHAYTTIAADVIARRHRLLGDDTFFLTGTDEHGQKVQRSAEAAGIPPQQFTDEVSASFRNLWKRMGITNDDFIRTTEERHHRGVQQLWRALEARGAIYLSSYTGQYCVSDEAFVDVPVGAACPTCGRTTETITEENYFFRLSDYQLPLIDLIESGALHIQPETARNEVLSFLRGDFVRILAASIETQKTANPQDILSELDLITGGVAVERGDLKRSSADNLFVPGALKDLSISRTTFDWGIKVPGNDKHVVYVWLDALANYISAIGYGAENRDDLTAEQKQAEQAKFARYWPADLHLVGKEITRFHCVYWPAILLALNPKLKHGSGEPMPQLTPAEHAAWAKDWLPKSIVANGWLLFEESKMSKSRGNVVRTETILDAFGPLCPPVPDSDTTAPGPLDSTGLQPGESGANNEGALAPGITSVALDSSGGSRGLQPTESTPQAEGALAPGLTPPTKAQQDLFAADVLRYFLLREIPFGQDGTFSFDALITRYNADLANGYGNLVSRTLNLIQQNQNGAIVAAVEPWLCQGQGEKSFVMVSKIKTSEGYFELEEDFSSTKTIIQMIRQLVSGCSGSIKDSGVPNLTSIIAMRIGLVDVYLSANAPWKLAKSCDSTDQLKMNEVLYTAVESIRIFTALLYPFIPYATASVWRQLGLGDIEEAARNGELNDLKWGDLQPGTKLGPLAPIFPRADKGLAQIMTDMESPSTPVAQTTPAPEPAAASTPEKSAPSVASVLSSSPEETSTISIDDFAKVDLRVAQIVVAERIPKADKLLRLEVDLGPNFPRRQILAGIAEHYTPESLIGRKVVIVANLAPRKMRGLESQGMVVAASIGPAGAPVLAGFLEDVELGARLK